MREKIVSYLGFARKSRNLISGYNSCLFALKGNKVKLLIIAEDLSENTVKKLSSSAKEKNINYRIYGSVEDLSRATGIQGRGIFAITDNNFAKVILDEIDKK